MVVRPWGHWTSIHKDERAELRLLEIVPGGFCTLHYHTKTINVMVVVAGEVEILADGTLITPFPCQAVTIAPGIVHRFRAKTKATVYELNLAAGKDDLDLTDSTQIAPAGVEVAIETP